MTGITRNREAELQGCAALSVEHVSKTFNRFSLLPRRAAGAPGQKGEVLHNVSFSVREGETTGLLGPNGAGKTTLLKIITNLIYPTSGRVMLHGLDVCENPTRARKMMGLVTCDERSFYWRLSGRQNLSYFGALYGLTKRQLQERTSELLEVLGLTAAADRSYQSYSSGMRQKLAIARGLMINPRVVLYDEPTRSLDPLSAHNIRKWIVEKRMASPHQTHVIATNQLSEAEHLCDRVLIVNRGQLIADGTPREIREKWNTRGHDTHRITYRGCTLNGHLVPDALAGLLEIIEEGTNERGKVLRLRTGKGGSGLTRALDMILRSGGIVVECQGEQPSFDDVFCALVQLNEEEQAQESGKVRG